MRGLLDVLPPEKACQERKPGAVFGDETVEPFGDGSNAGDSLVQPQRPLLIRRDGPCAKDRFGSRVDVPTRVDELHGLLALLASQFRKARCDGWVLEGDVFDAVTGALLPARDPATAEIAIAVEDQYGLGGWRSDAGHVEVLTEPGSRVN